MFNKFFLILLLAIACQTVVKTPVTIATESNLIKNLIKTAQTDNFNSNFQSSHICLSKRS